MKTIWKFPLEPVVGTQVIEMPKGAQILCVQRQDEILPETGGPGRAVHESVFVWAVVESGNKPEQRTFLMAFTGKEFPKKPGSVGKAFYIGTF